jgi:putative tricarboxylic transport membrane protein
VVENAQFVYDVVGMMLMATLGILVFGLVMVRPLIKILQVPREVIMPIVFVLCLVGAYSIAQRVFDIWVMLGFGVLGYLLRRHNYPMAPFVLGIVLGDLLDKNLRRGLVLSDGDLTPFFTRPISAALFAVCVLTVLLNIGALRRGLGRLFAGA